MKIKKIIAAICAAAAILSLTGCGNNDSDSVLDSSTVGNSTPASSTSKQESEPTVVSESTGEPVESSEPASEPVESSEPASEATVADGTLTLANCSELQSLIRIGSSSESGAEMKAFAEQYKGKTIELEMFTGLIDYDINDETRFNCCLLLAVQDGNIMSPYPGFAFEDVSYNDLPFTGDFIPDTFEISTFCLVRAEVVGYNSDREWIILDPVSIKVKG